MARRAPSGKTEAPEAPESAEVVAPVAPPLRGLAKLLDHYRNPDPKHADCLLPFRWEPGGAAESYRVVSKHGALLWLDGTPAVFPAAEAPEVYRYLRALRPLDEIKLHPNQ